MRPRSSIAASPPPWRPKPRSPTISPGCASPHPTSLGAARPRPRRLRPTRSGPQPASSPSAPHACGTSRRRWPPGPGSRASASCASGPAAVTASVGPCAPPGGRPSLWTELPAARARAGAWEWQRTPGPDRAERPGPPVRGIFPRRPDLASMCRPGPPDDHGECWEGRRAAMRRWAARAATVAVVTTLAGAPAGLSGPAIPAAAADAGIAASALPTGAVVVVGATAAAAEAAVVRAGGHVETPLPLARGGAARIGPAAAARLATAAVRVVRDMRIPVSSAGFAPGSALDTQLSALDPGPGWSLQAGSGVGVALVDTGVAETPDLRGRVVRGPDLSSDAGNRGR